MDLGPCIPYEGRINKYGYGSKVGGEEAHRAAYIKVFGPIPKGLEIDHLCHTYSDCEGGTSCLHRRCVNVDHMEAVTRRVNTQRGWRSRKPTCKNGHPFDERNTYIRSEKSKGRRACRACGAAYTRRYMAKKKALQGTSA